MSEFSQTVPELVSWARKNDFSLALPVERLHRFEHRNGLVEHGYPGWMEERGEQEAVVEGYGHAAAGEGVPHVHCVADDYQPGGFVCGGWEEGVGHASYLVSVERRFEGGLCGFG